MIGGEAVPPTVEAALLIGVVLLEAIVLYVGYGLAERLFGDRIVDRITNA
ncbi:hypothetical protein [Halapricum sp. CBA1109]|nr:hypothetical protein [Halapricum sp. CBA1109]